MSRLGELVTGAWVAVLLIGGAAVAGADPGAAPEIYPELRYFTKIDPVAYEQPDGQGYWFVTPQGLNCGIWFRGSFGCSGSIPGADTGVDKIGWVTGDARVHYDWTLATRFPQGQGAATIPPLSYIEAEGTRAGTTVDGSTYFERGPWRLLLAPDHTWLNG